MKNETLGKRLANLRKKRSMTQAQLAGKIEMSTSSVASWEIGSREPDNNMLTVLAEFFGVSTDYLLGKTNEIIPDSTDPKSNDKLYDIIARASELPDDDLGSYVDTIEFLLKQHEAKSKKEK